MHYYQFNIADYRKDTAHLNPIEHYIYRTLIDWYYLDEAPIPKETQTVIRRLRLGTEQEPNLNNVLTDFFDLTDSGWAHKRIDQEIFEYYEAKKNHWALKLTKSQRCAIQANRNAQKIKATPIWLTKDHKRQISVIYSQAAIKTAETGIPHEVDHIVPLRGKTVCGLHAPWNLQILPCYKNRQKSNLLEAE
jgi:uncharacterized protein YdaU (DUF1376 family)